MPQPGRQPMTTAWRLDIDTGLHEALAMRRHQLLDFIAAPRSGWCARPDTGAAPEALYWAGVARYKATNDPSALEQTAQAFAQRYQDTAWAKKASVWRKPPQTSGVEAQARV